MNRIRVIALNSAVNVAFPMSSQREVVSMPGLDWKCSSDLSSEGVPIKTSRASLNSETTVAQTVADPSGADFDSCCDVIRVGGDTMIGKTAETSMMIAMVRKPLLYEPLGLSNFTSSCGPK